MVGGMGEYDTDQQYSRRAVLGMAGSAGALALAGCGGEEQTLREERMYDCGFETELEEGESYGIPRADSQYTVSLEETYEDSEQIDVRVVKTLLDEEGQDKEGIDATIDLGVRSGIAPGDVERFEPGFHVWYIEPTEDGVRLCNGDSSLE